jgi:ATP-binding cassette subfamily C (CFTR/MRP) protein 1
MSAEFESNITSVERIREYIDQVPHEAVWVDENSRPSQNWPDKGRIEFNRYSVKYREELDFVLKNIDCKITPGEKIGIVGRTGAGSKQNYSCL